MIYNFLSDTKNNNSNWSNKIFFCVFYIQEYIVLKLIYSYTLKPEGIAIKLFETFNLEMEKFNFLRNLSFLLISIIRS